MNILQTFPLDADAIGPMVADLLTKLSSDIIAQVAMPGNFPAIRRAGTIIGMTVLLPEGEKLIPSGFRWIPGKGLIGNFVGEIRQPDWSHLELSETHLGSLRFSMDASYPSPMDDSFTMGDSFPMTDAQIAAATNATLTKHPGLRQANFYDLVGALVERQAPGSKGKTWIHVFKIYAERARFKRAKQSLGNHHAFGTW